MSRFKRTEIIKFPSHRPEDADKLYWSKLTDQVTIKEYGAIGTIDINPLDKNIVAVSAHNKIQLYDIATFELHKSFKKFKDTAFSGKFRFDGQLLCAGTGEGSIKVFDVNSKSALRNFSGHTAAVQQCQFQPVSGGGVVSWSDDSSVRVWDLTTQDCLQTLTHHSDYVRAGALSDRQPELVISGGYDHKIAVWDLRQPEKASMTMDHGSPVESVLVLAGGGLVVSAGGSNVRIWDLMSGGKLLTTLSPHLKTVTSLCLSHLGRYLVTGSLDKQVVWTEMSTFSQVHNKICSSSVMSVGVGGEDEYLAVGMLDGLIQMNKRKEDKLEDGMIVNSRRHRRHVKNHRYLQYTQFSPQAGEQVVTDNIHHENQSKHDKALRKFEYSKALDEVLKIHVQRTKPEYTYSVMMELSRREGLTRALAGRTEKQLNLLLQYIDRNISDIRFSRLCIHVCNILIDLYLPNHGMSHKIDFLFKKMKKKLDKEVSYQETLMELAGMVDLVLTASSNRLHDPSSSCLVDHRVCPLPPPLAPSSG